jgi:hypothetical protein
MTLDYFLNIPETRIKMFQFGFSEEADPVTKIQMKIVYFLSGGNIERGVG